MTLKLIEGNIWFGDGQQEGMDGEEKAVQQALAAAATGAARAVARKLLDVVVREAGQWEAVLRERRDARAGPASQRTSSAAAGGKRPCREAAHLCKESDKDPRW